MATQAQIDAARNAAIQKISRELPGLANPEKYINSKNQADIAGARKEYISTNLGLDSSLFKSGSNYDIAKANKAVAVKNLGLDYTKFAKSNYDIKYAQEAARLKGLGLTNSEKFVKANGQYDTGAAEESLIRDVYKDNPETYKYGGTYETGKQVLDPRTGQLVSEKKPIIKYDVQTAQQRYSSAQPKIEQKQEYPQTFTQAVNNYSAAFEKAVSIGLSNLNDADRATLRNAGKVVRDFGGKNLSESQKGIIERINDVDDTINDYDVKRKLTYDLASLIKGTPEYNALTPEEKKAADKRLKSEYGDIKAAKAKLVEDKRGLVRLEADAKNLAPRFQESFTRYNLSDVVQGIGSVAGVSKLRTGLEAGAELRGTGTLGAKLNSQVTDDQILADINTGNKARYKELYDIGTNATIDLQSQLDQAKQFLSDLPANDPRRSATQSQIDSIQKDLTQAQSDTLKAKNLYENYTPIGGEQAASAISRFRESLQLPEQRTLAQIKEIDPTTYESIINLQKQYATLAKEPIAPTTSPETEAFRKDVEQRIAAQVALGSQLGAEEQRQYQQAARAAQTARGNIFGVAPAVEEAVTTGAAGEQRLAARLGAAQGFLSSGQTMSDALARDVALRNSLQQSRLGAAADFMAGGPTAYNLASQRAAQQQGVLQNYLAAAQPQATGGFQATPSANIPYAYVNPMAGFQGAQNAANIYKTLADYQAQTYGDYTRAIASQPTGAQQFGAIASGISGFIPKISYTL